LDKEPNQEELKAKEDAIAASGGFNVPKLLRIKQNVIAGFRNNSVPMADYAEMLHEWTRMFKHLGRALSLAFTGKNISPNLLNMFYSMMYYYSYRYYRKSKCDIKQSKASY